jgi:hypothetical protein
MLKFLPNKLSTNKQKMKKLITLQIIYYLFIALTISSAQTLNARLEYPFVDGEQQGIYTGGVQVKTGTLRVGETIQVNDDGGNIFQLKINEIEDNDLDTKVSSLTAGKAGYIILQTLDKKKLPKIEGGFNLGEKQLSNSKNISSTRNNMEIGTTCQINKIKWDGINYYKSSSYFPNGNTFLKTKKPYLIISFKAGLKPDDRQLTLTLSNFKGDVGKVDKDLFEIALTGAVSGIADKSCIVSNWEKGQANTKHTPFDLEFTKWEDKGSYILASLKYSGKLYALNLFSGLIGKRCEDLMISGGVVTDLKLEKN